VTAEVFLALLTFAFVGAATPGPNTMLLLASGVNFGFARTVPHMLGIPVGFGLLQLAIGFGLGQVLERAPALFTALKIAGACYLLWLAWKIANAGPPSEPSASGEGTGKPFSLFEAALFQWVNPKAWVVIVSAMTIYTDPENYTRTVLLVILAFMLALGPAVTLWAGAGTALRRFLSDPKYLRVFNITMALLLVASLWPMLR